MIYSKSLTVSQITEHQMDGRVSWQTCRRKQQWCKLTHLPGISLGRTSKITKTSANTAVFRPKIKHITSKILVKILLREATFRFYLFISRPKQDALRAVSSATLSSLVSFSVPFPPPLFFNTLWSQFASKNALFSLTITEWDIIHLQSLYGKSILEIAFPITPHVLKSC